MRRQPKNRHILPWVAGLALLSASAGLSAGRQPAGRVPPPAPAGETPPAGEEFFERKVRPVLAEHCFRCHASTVKAPMGGLILDSRAGALKGGASGPALVPGDPEKSPLIRAVRHTDPVLKMPPAAKLPPASIEALATWVKMGAPWPSGPVPSSEFRVPSSGKGEPGRRNSRLAERWWSFRPLGKPVVPVVRDRAWVKTPVDAFILAELEKRGLRPSPPADPRTLIRRVTFDLTGLPPTPSEVEAFVRESAAERVLGVGPRALGKAPSDGNTPTHPHTHTPTPPRQNANSSTAYERLVDRLLASPQYGERWARHWLDLVRYAETRGHEFDPVIPNAWQYRDYVVRALNADVPYDQFVREHLAGDLLERPRLNPERGFNESILGTGFWFLGEDVHSPVDTRQDETDRLDNRLDVMGKTFLGLTVGCARCHDHKFDPISQKDYYGLTGFLLSATYRQAPFETLEHNRRVAEGLQRLQERAGPVLLKEIARVERPGIEQAAAYLLAAAARLPRAPGATLTALQAPSNPALSPVLVERWTSELLQARQDARHPLHPFARATAGQVAAPAARAEERPQPPSRPEQVLVDYAHPGPEGWQADGFTFGLRPLRPGDVILGDREDAPVAEVVTRAAAWRDPAWNALRPAPDTERDHGALGTWDRPGRTLRTPRVTLQSGMLRYLVRGSGRAYASIDSHLIVAGPLHGRVLLEWNGAPDRWQWITHDLRPYRGHRAHVEFTPRTPDGLLAIARVVESEQDPGSPDTPGILLTGSEPSAATPEALAAACAARLRGAADAMASGMGAPGDRGAHAEVAAWLARRLDLFVVDERARQELSAVARPLIQERARLIGEIRAESHTAPAMLEGNGVDECVLRRGNYRSPGQAVPRRLLEVLGGENQPPVPVGSGRLELARRMLVHPLAARVIVNRVWQHHFGEGLVRTPDDFGTRGARPSHPELLDWLAAAFTAPATPGGGSMGVWVCECMAVEQSVPRAAPAKSPIGKATSGLVKRPPRGVNASPTHPHPHTPAQGLGWSLKQLHRLIVTSATYQQSSECGMRNAECGVKGPQAPRTARLAVKRKPGSRNPQSAIRIPQSVDPENRLYWRGSVRRLEAEAIRDAILAVSGRLDRKPYGPSVLPYLTQFTEGRGRPGSSGPLDGDGRRSLYIGIRRNFLPPLFLAFDFPIPFTTIGRRSTSTVPSQALALMNNPFVAQQAELWAKRVLAGESPTREQRVTDMYLTAFARPPSAPELSAALSFLADEDRQYGGTDDPRAWTDLCHVLLNTKEFIFIN